MGNFDSMIYGRSDKGSYDTSIGFNEDEVIIIY